MVGKNQIKRITGLAQKKFRDASGQFIVEGEKAIGEWIDAGQLPLELYVTDMAFADVPQRTLIDAAEMKKISALTTPVNCLAVFQKPDDILPPQTGLIMALDDVRDPGNLGTIIRLCDWFGIPHLVCSRESADSFNPKVVQATMGSLARVAVSYVDLPDYLGKLKVPVLGTFMDGDSIYEKDLPKEGVIVMGNESNGISKAVEEKCSGRIAIPRFGSKTESLNVATAAAITLSEFRRQP